MKKIVIISLISIGIITSNSCKKLDELTQFDLDYTSKVTVPSSSVVNIPIDLSTPDIETNYQDQLSSNETSTDLVDDIKLAVMNINAKEPQGSNLDFLKSVQVFISVDGLDEIEIASSNDIPDGLTTLELSVSSVNLKDYITKENIKFRIKTTTDKAITQDRDLEIFTRFSVNAKILGV